MTRIIIHLVVLICLLGSVALAADVTGKWTAQVPGRDGETREMTFNFKANGSTLTGTISSPMGDREFTEGKINGDEVSFVMVIDRGGDPMKMIYKGKVAGNEIKFTTSREGSDRVREFTAKKAS